MSKVQTMRSISALTRRSQEHELTVIREAAARLCPSFRVLSTMNEHVFIQDSDTGDVFRMEYVRDNYRVTFSDCQSIIVDEDQESITEDRNDQSRLLVEALDIEDQAALGHLSKGLIESHRQDVRLSFNPALKGTGLRYIIGERLEEASEAIRKAVRTSLRCFPPVTAVLPNGQITVDTTMPPQLGESEIRPIMLHRLHYARSASKTLPKNEAFASLVREAHKLPDKGQVYVDLLERFSGELLPLTEIERRSIFSEALGDDSSEVTLDRAMYNFNRVAKHLKGQQLKKLHQLVGSIEEGASLPEKNVQFLEEAVTIDSTTGLDLKELRDLMKEVLADAENNIFFSGHLGEKFRQAIENLDRMLESGKIDFGYAQVALNLLSQFAPLTYYPGTDINNAVNMDQAFPTNFDKGMALAQTQSGLYRRGMGMREGTRAGHPPENYDGNYKFAYSIKNPNTPSSTKENKVFQDFKDALLKHAHVGDETYHMEPSPYKKGYAVFSFPSPPITAGDLEQIHKVAKKFKLEKVDPPLWFDRRLREDRQCLVDEDLKSELTKVMGNWVPIKTAKDLKNTIQTAISILRNNGKDKIADQWEAKLKNMPTKMGKEAINVILMAMGMEVGLIESKKPTHEDILENHDPEFGDYSWFVDKLGNDLVLVVAEADEDGFLTAYTRAAGHSSVSKPYLRTEARKISIHEAAEHQDIMGFPAEYRRLAEAEEVTRWYSPDHLAELAKERESRIVAWTPVLEESRLPQRCASGIRLRVLSYATDETEAILTDRHLIEIYEADGTRKSPLMNEASSDEADSNKDCLTEKKDDDGGEDDGGSDDGKSSKALRRQVKHLRKEMDDIDDAQDRMAKEDAIRELLKQAHDLERVEEPQVHVGKTDENDGQALIIKPDESKFHFDGKSWKSIDELAEEELTKYEEIEDIHKLSVKAVMALSEDVLTEEEIEVLEERPTRERETSTVDEAKKIDIDFQVNVLIDGDLLMDVEAEERIDNVTIKEIKKWAFDVLNKTKKPLAAQGFKIKKISEDDGIYSLSGETTEDIVGDRSERRSNNQGNMASVWMSDALDSINYKSTKIKGHKISLDPESGWIAESTDSGDEIINEDLTLGKTDKAVIKAFAEKKKAESKKLESTGTSLDGLWMGGKGIAEWKSGKIHLGPNAGRSIQTVQRFLMKKAAAKFDFSDEDQKIYFKEGIDEAYGDIGQLNGHFEQFQREYDNGDMTVDAAIRKCDEFHKAIRKQRTNCGPDAGELSKCDTMKDQIEEFEEQLRVRKSNQKQTPEDAEKPEK